MTRTLEALAQTGSPVARIMGTTHLVGAMGDPVAQVRAPVVFNRLFETLGVDAVCIPMHVTPAGLAVAMEGLRALENLVGISVTIPHKAAIVTLLDGVSERAKRVGVVNAVRREADGRLVGDIFDGEGFVGGLGGQGIAIQGAKAWLVGAGGAGTAIAFALLDHGLAHLTLTDSAADRADSLAARLLRHFPGQVAVQHPDAALAIADRFDMAINATPLGMNAGDALPFDPKRLAARTAVADVIMKPPTTRLLVEAERAGRRIHHGRHMLDHQVELYAEFLGFRHLPKRTKPPHSFDG